VRSDVDYKSPVAAVPPREESRLPTPSLLLLLQLRAQVGHSSQSFATRSLSSGSSEGSIDEPK